jgi:uncharacterized protein
MTPRSNKYLAQGLSGETFKDVLIIDSHVHIGHWPRMFIAQPEWLQMLHTMDRIGIRAAAVNGILLPDFRKGNDIVHELVQHYPGRVIGVMALNPLYRAKEIEEEINRCSREAGFRGIKIHEFVLRGAWGDSYHPSLLEPILEGAEQKGLPILYHGLITEEMIKSHPKVSFICAHGPAYIDLSIRWSRYENFYVDTAYSVVIPGTFELFVNKLGSERILFGSDAPLSSPNIRIGQVLAARISDAALLNILGHNAARLYKFC